METKVNKRRLQNGQKAISSSPSSNHSSQSSKKVLTKHSGSLEIIEGDASDLYNPDREDSESSSRPSSQAFQRPWSRGSLGSVPPRPDSTLSRRVATPTKQISLQAVKRKEESSEPFEPDVDFQALNLDKSYNRAWDLSNFTDEDSSRVSTPKLDAESDHFGPQHATKLRLPRLPEKQAITSERNGSAVAGPSYSEHYSEPVRAGVRQGAAGVERGADDNCVVPSTEDDDDEEEEEEAGGDGNESSEEEERRAPNELLMEFVECLMKKDYKNAEKLCKMILLYEPTNPEALKFQPVIEEKLRLDAEAEAEEANDDGDEDDNDDDDDDDDEEGDDEDGDGDSEDDDDDSSSDDDDDSDDSDEEEESIFRTMAAAVASNYYAANPAPAGDPGLPRRPDSGIASDPES